MLAWTDTDALSSHAVPEVSSVQTHLEPLGEEAAGTAVAGDAATVLMALGLIGTGFLAVPILTGSGAYAVAEAAGWKCGLDEKPGRANS